MTTVKVQNCKVNNASKFLNKKLLSACDNEDVDLVYILLKQGADPNAKDEAGKTALFYAINKYCSRIVRLLLKKGADPNVYIPGVGTVLCYSIEQSGDVPKVVRVLIEHPTTNLDYPDHNGNPPLFIAFDRCYEELVQCLILKGCNPNCKKVPDYWDTNNKPISSPDGEELIIHLVGDSSTPESLRMLIKAGANYKAVYKGKTALHNAIFENKSENVRVFLKETEFGKEIKEPDSPYLLYAIEEGAVSCIDIMLQYGARLNVETFNSIRDKIEEEFPELIDEFENSLVHSE